MRNLIVSMALVLLAGVSAFAQNDAKKYTSFIVNVARNVSWDGGGADFIISVMGDDQLADELTAKLKDKQIGMRKIVIKRASSANDLGECNIVVVNKPAYKHMDAVTSQMKSQKCIVIACTRGMCSNGADFALYSQGDKLGFQLSERNINAHGLKVTGKLKDLGEIVG